MWSWLQYTLWSVSDFFLTLIQQSCILYAATGYKWRVVIARSLFTLFTLLLCNLVHISWKVFKHWDHKDVFRYNLRWISNQVQLHTKSMERLEWAWTDANSSWRHKMRQRHVCGSWKCLNFSKKLGLIMGFYDSTSQTYKDRRDRERDCKKNLEVLLNSEICQKLSWTHTHMVDAFIFS